MAFRDPIGGKFRCRGLRTSSSTTSAKHLPHSHASSLSKKLKRPHLHPGYVLQEHRTGLSTSHASKEQLEHQRWSSMASPLRVYAPTREDISVTSSDSSQQSDTSQYDVTSIALDPPEDSSSSTSSSVSTSQILEPVKADMETMNANLRGIVGGRHPLLIQAADQIFGAGGKKLRPAIVFLASRATCACTGQSDLTPQHRRLAEIVEMIHTASLVHDDVLDESDVRRGEKPMCLHPRSLCSCHTCPVCQQGGQTQAVCCVLRRSHSQQKVWHQGSSFGWRLPICTVFMVFG